MNPLRFATMLVGVLVLHIAFTSAAEPKKIGDYTLYNGGDATVEEGKAKLKGPGEADGPMFLVRQIDTADEIVTITGPIRYAGGPHRTLGLVVGSSEQPGSFVTGVARWGMNKISVIQYRAADGFGKEHGKRDGLAKNLPAAEAGVDVTLSVDMANRQITLVAGANRPLTWAAAVPLKKIDLVGFTVQGKTQAEFGELKVTTGEEAKAAAAKAVAEANEALEQQQGAAPAPAETGGAARGIITQGEIAGAADLAKAGWVDNAQGRPPTMLALEATPEGQILAVDVQGRTDASTSQPIAFHKGKVIHIELTGRAVGQVEHINATLSNRKFDFIDWPIHREWHRYTLQARSNGGSYKFNLRLRGVGTFQIRDFVVTERDDFDLPEIKTPPVGEMLVNGDFVLGHLGWSFIHPLNDSGIASDDHPDPAQLVKSNADGQGYAAVLPEGTRTLMHSGEEMMFYYGREYTITAKGQAQDGDLSAILVRPGMAAATNEVIPLNFVDGQAKVTFPMKVPEEGLFHTPQQAFCLRVRHMGEGAARLESISIREEGPNAPQTVGPRAGVALLVKGESRGWATLGEPVTVRVHTHALAQGSSIQLVVLDERGEAVRREPLTLKPGASRQPGAEIVMDNLSPGWFRFSVESSEDGLKVVGEDLAVLLPGDPHEKRNGFLGAHLRTLNKPEHLDLMNALGIKHIREWNLAWTRLQPQRDTVIKVPEALLDAYHNAGIEPMVVLNGTPPWASSGPDGGTNYPAANMDDWKHYVREVVTQAGSRVRYYEIWNEPNHNSLQIAPGTYKDKEEAYAKLVEVAYPVIKAANPNAVVVVGASAGHPSFSIRAITRHGLKDHFDATSYHAYGGADNAAGGAKAFSYTQDYLQQQLATLGRSGTPIHDTESGLRYMPDGPAGAFDAMVLAKGLVARQAAGFDRYYMYNAYPRQYALNYNFNMILGFNDRPMVSVPMIATWDRVLGTSTYVKNLGNDNEGRHIYLFRRADGHDVIAAWLSSAQASTDPQLAGMKDPIVIDGFGRHVASGPDGQSLRLTPDLQYFVPEALVAKLGVNVK